MSAATVGPERGGLRRLASGYAVLVVPGFCLIVLGALVRAHEAGLACPDWPLCFGRLVPEMDLRVGFEWSHRVLAGAVSLGFVALSLALLRRSDAPRTARRLVALAGGLLIVQVLLGALTVWHLLASWTVTSHLVTGNAFVLTLLLIALCLRGAPRSASARARAWLGAAAALLFVQLVLGGLVSSRFAGLACPEWPTCNGGRWFPTWRGNVGLHLLHRWNAILLLAAVALAAWRVRGDARLRRPAALAAALVLAQLGVGVANVRLGIPVEVTGLHSALAAGLVLSLGSALYLAWAPPGAARD